jgi:HTH-type transcriptional regulator / antitoxin HigA
MNVTARARRPGAPLRIDARRYRRLLGEAMPVVIETEQEYQQLLGALEALMDKDDDAMSPEDGRLLKLLAMLVEEYEDRKIPLPRGEPHKMVKYLLEEKGRKPSDLWPALGSKSRVSETLAGKRSISKDQAKNLAAFFHVPLELFTRLGQ